jgi:hypothetical protein
MCSYPAVQIHMLGKVSLFKMLNPVIMHNSPHLHMQHIEGRDNSKSGKFWTSMNHLKIVLSCVNVRYHFPFRLHTDTWKTTSFMNCLVNTCKYTLSQIPPFRKMPLIFSYSRKCIATTKSIHKMHVTILGVGKHKRHITPPHN